MQRGFGLVGVALLAACAPTPHVTRPEVTVPAAQVDETAPTVTVELEAFVPDLPLHPQHTVLLEPGGHVARWSPTAPARFRALEPDAVFSVRVLDALIEPTSPLKPGARTVVPAISLAPLRSPDQKREHIRLFVDLRDAARPHLEWRRFDGLLKRRPFATDVEKQASEVRAVWEQHDAREPVPLRHLTTLLVGPDTTLKAVRDMAEVVRGWHSGPKPAVVQVSRYGWYYGALPSVDARVAAWRNPVKRFDVTLSDHSGDVTVGVARAALLEVALSLHACPQHRDATFDEALPIELRALSAGRIHAAVIRRFREGEQRGSKCTDYDESMGLCQRLAQPEPTPIPYAVDAEIQQCLVGVLKSVALPPTVAAGSVKVVFTPR